MLNTQLCKGTKEAEEEGGDTITVPVSNSVTMTVSKITPYLLPSALYLAAAIVFKRLISEPEI